jgi:hypothetical protein
MSQESTGTLSKDLIGAPHPGHELGGDTIDLPAGTLKITTFKKEPTSKPNTPTRTAITLAGQVTI